MVPRGGGSAATSDARPADRAQQCAALGPAQPAARLATRIDPLAPYTDTGIGLPRNSNVTDWLQAGPGEQGSLSIRGMSPVAPSPIVPTVRVVDPFPEAASVPNAAGGSGAVVSSAPVVRWIPDQPSYAAEVADGAGIVDAPASETAVTTIRAPQRAPENNPRGLMRISAIGGAASNRPSTEASATEPTIAAAVAAPIASASRAPTAAPAPALTANVAPATTDVSSLAQQRSAAAAPATTSIARPAPVAATPRPEMAEEPSVELLDRVQDSPTWAQPGSHAFPPPSVDPPPHAVPSGAQPTATGSRRVVSPPQSALAPPPTSMASISPAEASRHMAIISKRAQEHIDYGFDLAERGALYSAEVEFAQSLLLVAQSLDAHYRTQFHSQAVAAGLTALSEADDFVPRAGRSAVKIDDVIATHKTPVWNDKNTEGLPPLVAMQRYYAFAQQQFVAAAGRDPSAAMALYGLGRLQTALASEHGVKKMTAGPKAMALYQAAISVDPQNYLAANELGVMLARYGQLEEAEAALRRSVQIAPRPENWKNLAAVYERMGDLHSARDALARRQLALEAGARPGRVTTADRPPLKLVDNETFTKQSGPAGADEMLSSEKSPGSPAPEASAVQGEKQSTGAFGWIGDKVSGGMTRVVGPSKPKAAQVR